MKFKLPIGHFFIRFVFLCLAAHFSALMITAQQPDSPAPTPTPSLEKRFLKNILRDQKRIYTAPFNLRASDLKWLVPLGLSEAALIATDRQTAGALNHNRSRDQISSKISYFGSGYGTGAVAAGFYLFGRIKNNDRARETGLLAGEALIDSGILVTILKAATQRERPLNGERHGRFFTGGNSFPSGHSAAAWSLATVVAYEYKDKPLIKYGAYGLAAAVGIARFTGQKHFLGDVLIGSAIGYGIGRFVYRTHHDSSLDSGNTGTNQSGSQSKLFPLITPYYSRSARIYGASMRWSF